MDGVDVCRRVRQFSAVPIIVLSAAATEERKVAALDLGADDYITKPFGMAELEARLRVALRRGPGAGDSPSELVVGDLAIDLVHHMASVGAGTSTSRPGSSTCSSSWPATPARCAPTT